MEEQTTQVTPTATGTSQQNSNRKLLLMVGVAVAALLIIIGAIVAIVVVLNNRPSATGLSAVNAANPDQSLQILQDVTELEFDAADAESTLALFGDYAKASGVGMEMTVTSEGLSLSLKGVAQTMSNGEGAGEFDMEIEIDGSLMGTPESIKAAVSIIALDKVTYLNVTSADTTVASYLSMFGLQQNKWYFVSASEDAPVDTTAVTSQFTSLAENVEFVSATATSPRAVDGKEIPCMIVTAQAKTAGAKNEDYTLCKGADLFPLFLSFKSTQVGAEADFTLMLTEAGARQNIVAPEGAVDLTELFAGAAGASQSTLYDFEY